MAHLNIDERRSIVVKSMKSGYSRKIAKQIANEFNCSLTAIYMDYALLFRKISAPVLVNKKRKQLILNRDNHTCQYCGSKKERLIIEHIIPLTKGGVASNGNLVAACQSCNLRKRFNVWIPLNIDILLKTNRTWGELILKMAILDARTTKIYIPTKKLTKYVAKSGEWKKKKIIRISETGEEKKYNSLTEASKENNIALSSISLCLSGKYKKSKNYFWKYEEENNA